MRRGAANKRVPELHMRLSFFFLFQSNNGTHRHIKDSLPLSSVRSVIFRFK